MTTIKRQIKEFEKDLDSLQADREKAGERAGELRAEIETVLDAMGAASFDSFRGVAGADKQLDGLRERRGQLETELSLVEKAAEGAEVRIAAVAGELAEAYREVNKERVAELETQLRGLEEQTEALLRLAGEGMDEMASVQHELASLASGLTVSGAAASARNAKMATA